MTSFRGPIHKLKLAFGEDGKVCAGIRRYSQSLEDD